MRHADIAPPERFADYRRSGPNGPTDRRERGHVVCVPGFGRHRAYCELDDVWSSDLVMSQGRPECGDGLRGESPSRARP
jgi:hypothetical protein